MSSRNVVDLRKRAPGPSPARQTPLPLRPQKRVSPVRVRRRRVRLIATSIGAALAVALVFAASYVSYLPRYSVRSIQVAGTQQVAPNAIADYAATLIYDGSHHFFSRANVLLYPKALLQKEIPLEFPRIASATISSPSLLSSAITITVTERQPFAIWCAENTADCYEIDSTGFVFARAPNNAATSGEYVFSGGISTSSPVIGQTFASGHTQGLVALLQLLGESNLTPLGASVKSDQDFSIPLAAGYSIYASFGEDPGTLVNNLQLALSSGLSDQTQDLEYIDLRFGNKVFYRLKGKDQQQTAASAQ